MSGEPPGQLCIWAEGLLVPGLGFQPLHSCVLVPLFSGNYTHLSTGKKWVTGKAAFGPKAQG